jgi:hypothetical protein
MIICYKFKLSSCVEVKSFIVHSCVYSPFIKDAGIIGIGKEFRRKKATGLNSSFSSFYTGLYDLIFNEILDSLLKLWVNIQGEKLI